MDTTKVTCDTHVFRASSGLESGIMKVVTHDGNFHADDVMAVGLLLLEADYQDMALELRRSRNRGDWSWLINSESFRWLELPDYIVDVGGEFVPSEGKLDHHQNGAPSWPGIYDSPLASAGMVWNYALSERVRKIYHADHVQSFIRSIDAADNGIAVNDSSFSGMIAACNLNPYGGGFSPSYTAELQAETDMRFCHLAKLIRHSLYELTEYGSPTFEESVRNDPDVKAWLKETAEHKQESRCRIYAAFRRAENGLILLDREEIALHSALGEAPEGLEYAIYPATDGTWMVRQVPTSPGSFEGRKPLPASWAGKRDSELAEETGVADAVFCHKGRFIAGARSEAGAYKLAELALSK